MNVEFAPVTLILISANFMIPRLKKEKVLVIVKSIKGDASCAINLNIFLVEVIIAFNIPGTLLDEMYKSHVLA